MHASDVFESRFIIVIIQGDTYIIIMMTSQPFYVSFFAIQLHNIRCNLKIKKKDMSCNAVIIFTWGMIQMLWSQAEEYDIPLENV